MFNFFKKKSKDISNTKDNNKPKSILNNKDILAEYQDVISSSIKSYIEIKAKKTDKLPLWQSKFQGDPYLPEKQNYPKDNNGKYLYLLAQINFEEMPPLAPYPKNGLLQFWISDDDLYGLNFDNQLIQDSFRVIYYPEIQKKNLIKDFSFLPARENSPMEIETEYALHFCKKEMPAGYMDYRFYEYFPESEDEFDGAYMNAYDDRGHRIGGYAGFTQLDPRNREEDGYKDKDLLLLQIDTDDESQIMWGDVGVANFFINETALKKRDFSQILYNWDCH